MSLKRKTDKILFHQMSKRVIDRKEILNERKYFLAGYLDNDQVVYNPYP